MQSKVLAKIEQIARYRVLGKKDSWIAQTIGISMGGLGRIIATEQYKAIEASVRQQLAAKMDNELENQRVAVMRQELADAVPDALKFIIDQARKGQDMRARMIAAKEVLDRDGTFAKKVTARQEAPPPSATLPDSVLAATQSESEKAVNALASLLSTAKPAEA